MLVDEIAKTDLATITDSSAPSAPLNSRLPDPQFAHVYSVVIRDVKDDSVVAELSLDVVHRNSHFLNSSKSLSVKNKRINSVSMREWPAFVAQHVSLSRAGCLSPPS